MTTASDSNAEHTARDSRPTRWRRWIQLGGIVALATTVVVGALVLRGDRGVIARALDVDLPASAHGIQLWADNWTFGRFLLRGELAAVLLLDRADAAGLFARVLRKKGYAGGGSGPPLDDFLAAHGFEPVGQLVQQRPERVAVCERSDLVAIVTEYWGRPDQVVTVKIRRMD